MRLSIASWTLAAIISSTRAEANCTVDRSCSLIDPPLMVYTKSDVTPTHECLAGSYYGSYGRPLRQLYIAELECLEKVLDMPTRYSEGGPVYDRFESLVRLSPERRLVWIQEAGIDESIRGEEPTFQEFMDEMDEVGFGIRQGWRKQIPEKDWQAQLACEAENEALMSKIEAEKFPDMDTVDGATWSRYMEELFQLFEPRDCAPEVDHADFDSLAFEDAFILSQSENDAILSVPKYLLPHLDSILPRFVIPIVIPEIPLVNNPVPKDAIKRIKDIISKLSFNPTIASILSSLSTVTMRKDVGYLTGEGGSGLISRHSFTDGAKDAANWIAAQIEKSGAVCEQRPFLEGFSPNVICRYPATLNTTATTILSAHYDSRGSFGSLRAPGGDDDGSGVTHLLAIARVIGEKNIVLHHNLELVAFAGEEQGLLGSKTYSHELRKQDANITLHIQADMLAYRSPSEPMQLGLPELIGLPEAAHLVANISKIYAPELNVGYTLACCSDHQSFHEQGFPATQVFERAGGIIDPMYHNSGDISNRTGYDFEQLRSISKVTFATILETVGFDYQVGTDTDGLGSDRGSVFVGMGDFPTGHDSGGFLRVKGGK